MTNREVIGGLAKVWMKVRRPKHTLIVEVENWIAKSLFRMSSGMPSFLQYKIS